MSLTDDLKAGRPVEIAADRDAVRRAARAAADEASGWAASGGTVGKFKVKEVRAAERGITFAVSAPSGRQLMLFRVEDPAAGPLTSVSVGIGDHLETQTRGAFGLPLDRRRIAGAPAYEKFLNAFGTRLAQL